MKYIDLTLETQPQNLAFDEALLDLCEDGYPEEILRFWEPKEYFVVLGYSNPRETSADLKKCKSRNIPVLRRSSGGGTVLLGPGCLNYALILKMNRSKDLLDLSKTNRSILTRNKNALENILGEPFHVMGDTDLTSGYLKFSGNAQRRKKNFLLFHGTFLLNFELNLIQELLPVPQRQPPYRQNRSHNDFLTNLGIPADPVKKTLKNFWETLEELDHIPLGQMNELVKTKYANRAWIEKF